MISQHLALLKKMTCVAICVCAGHGRPLRHGLGTRAPHHRLRLESLQEGQRLLSHHQVGYFGNLILFCAELLICHWIVLELGTFFFRILETVKIKCGAKESEIWPYIVQVLLLGAFSDHLFIGAQIVFPLILFLAFATYLHSTRSCVPPLMSWESSFLR